MALPSGNRPPRSAPPKPKAKTVEFRKWKGVNVTDARVAIADDEFSWLENMLTVGDGAIQGLPGPGASVATIGAGVFSIWGFTLNGSPVLITVNTDGSMDQVTPGGVVTSIGGAATVTTGAHLTIWQGTPILILDPVHGYYSWDGATLTLIDATKVGSSIAVFQGRVWIGNNRTLQYTAPDTFNNFTAGDGAGSTIITDEAFQGNIIALASALEELWIMGQSAIEALANVQATGTAPSVITTFTITNVVTNLGTNSPQSVLGYFRALAFFAPFGAYALSGVTPQKLSGKLDGLFPSLTLTPDVPAAVAVVQNLLVLLFLVTYTGTQSVSGASGPLVLGFKEGQWFFASQGASLRWITSLVVSGVAQAWGTDGSGIFQLFGASASTAVSYKAQTRLNPFGNATTQKATTKVGFEFQGSNPIAPTLTLDSESSSVPVPVTSGNLVTWVNNAGQVVTWLNNSGQVVNWLAQGMVLSRADVAQFGHYLGFTLTGNDPPYRVQAIELEYEETRQWGTP